MKVFISHQKVDSELAGGIAKRLHETHQIECYLDIIDPNASQAGDELGEHLRNELGKCTQLMAVVSENTKSSWWVPWEIGVATEKDYPIATFARDNTPLPEYLKKWPYLKTAADLDEYAKVTKTIANTLKLRKSYLTEASARRSSTQEFYRILRGTLGQ
ncbi:toll/interleukin-1 receptor domain-containing protein [Methylocaldum sp.]|uniref:toll/interleukin-1 receptor domain-containing protein n=1 Tax=Methylocaldum sp. TaxID=1969727 RepID=UPI002D6EBEE4|nr:toll/interleukin-1 receptor domain-containing protein [Methylocaldum sp.]HYE33861.1 toll/interleukin-1 receptor domain-containing protein [Methylocaldum sp.]